MCNQSWVYFFIQKQCRADFWSGGPFRKFIPSTISLSRFFEFFIYLEWNFDVADLPLILNPLPEFRYPLELKIVTLGVNERISIKEV